MKLLKPSWVNHDDKPIFSVDIHPAGKRFATGGQGGDSGRVVVWNLNSVLYESVEVDINIPKMLCQMDNHLACVNCVRWSNSGSFLASGGDDRLVMVWGLSTTVGSAAKNKAETWRCLSTLRGHAGDVLDLAWSPLDKWLASCSVDNTIIIWNAEKFPEMVCVLNGHTGLVKGVAWDPVGKYLASQSDDKSLRVWKTADWSSETIITEPFDECGGTTHVLRLSWSPDGQYVLSAHAMNGGGPTAQVVERDGWRCDKDFVGHRKAVTCARFNSNIMVKEGKKCCCAAVGARDRALSIWLTSLKRPLVVVHDLFADSVLDLSWSSDGLNLLACSSDGTVACIQFTNKEIGTPLTSEEKNAFYEKIYGKCLANDSGGDLSSNLLVECTDILLAREKQEAKKIDTTPKSEKSQSKASPPRPLDTQIETRTSDGKRRITPVFIPSTNHDANESLGSVPGNLENCFSSSSQSKSRIRVERRDDIIIHPNVGNHAANKSASQEHNGSALDVRLRTRGSAPTTAPSLDGGGAPQPQATAGTPVPPALQPPALGGAGPIVRAAGALRLQVVNKAYNTQYGALSRLQLIPNNSLSNEAVWETYLGSPVSCVSCSARWVCVGCTDGSLHVWGLQAKRATRALPPIALSGPAARLALCDVSLVCVSAAADLVVWDLERAVCSFRPTTFRYLLEQGATVTSCSLLEDGNPMITLSNGKSYIYSKTLYSWVIWLDARCGVRRACVGSPHTRAPPAERATLYAHHHASTPHSKYSSVAAGSWLERQSSSSLHLRLRTHYRHWSLAHFAHTITYGTEEQLRYMLDDMLGPSHCTSTPKKWQPTILGIKKHEILEEMLSLLVRELRWQRLYTEYSEQLEALRAQRVNETGLVNGHV